MMMTPAGLALFYGGMSRYKNLLNTISMTLVPIVSPALSGLDGDIPLPLARAQTCLSGI